VQGNLFFSPVPVKHIVTQRVSPQTRFDEFCSLANNHFLQAVECCVGAHGH
jgi:hypothetical protein